MSGETSKLVPKLRFPEFREAVGWTEQFGDSLFDQISDKKPEPGLPVLAITQEHGAIPRHMIDYHVSVTEKSIESYKVVQVGDFIISLRSFQGGIEYSQYQGICSPAYVVLRRRGGGSDAYFRHYLKTDRFIQILTKNLEGLRDGKMISYKQFSELQIPVPVSEEQQKIANCLSSLDELIAALARKVDALKTHKKGLMQQLFPREGETQPRLRLPEFRDAGAWKTKKLRDISTINQGLQIPISKRFTKKVVNSYLYITNEFLRESPKNTYYIQNPQPSVICNEDDILMTRTGNTGQVVTNVSGAFHNNFFKIKYSNEVDKNFYICFLKSESTQRTILSLAGTSTIPDLNHGDFYKIEIAMPPMLAEQQKIANFLSSINELITTATQELETLKTHKKGLMQQLFPLAETVEA
jgi:type I restriction enzyme S subunit